jgi:hypothetical protein
LTSSKTAIPAVFSRYFDILMLLVTRFHHFLVNGICKEGGDGEQRKQVHRRSTHTSNTFVCQRATCWNASPRFLQIILNKGLSSSLLLIICGIPGNT